MPDVPVIIELLIFRGLDSDTALGYRYEQHPLPVAVAPEQYVRRLLAVGPSMVLVPVGQQFDPRGGHVIDGWAVVPDPHPGQPAQPLTQLSDHANPTVHAIHRRAHLAAHALGGHLSVNPRTIDASLVNLLRQC